MQEQLINFETAKLSKEKGFAYGSINVFIRHADKSVHEEVNFYTVNGLKDCDLSELTFTVYERPTQSLLQKWLRDVKSIGVIVDYDNYAKIGYTFKINYGLYPNNKEINSNGELKIPPFITYEEALESGLQEALKLI